MHRELLLERLARKTRGIDKKNLLKYQRNLSAALRFKLDKV